MRILPGNMAWMRMYVVRVLPGNMTGMSMYVMRVLPGNMAGMRMYVVRVLPDIEHDGDEDVCSVSFTWEHGGEEDEAGQGVLVIVNTSTSRPPGESKSSTDSTSRHKPFRLRRTGMVSNFTDSAAASRPVAGAFRVPCAPCESGTPS